MQTVASYSNLGEAGVAHSVLEGSGIAAHLENVESSVNLSGGLPAIHLVVEETDYERACELLAPLGAPPGQDTSAIDEVQRKFVAWMRRAADFVAKL